MEKRFLIVIFFLVQVFSYGQEAKLSKNYNQTLVFLASEFEFNKETLIQKLKHKKSVYRWMALKVIGDETINLKDHEWIIPIVVSIVDKDKNVDIRAKAIGILYKIKGADILNLPCIQKTFHDKNWKIRLKILFCVEKMDLGKQKNISLLSHFLKDPESILRMKASKILKKPPIPKYSFLINSAHSNNNFVSIRLFKWKQGKFYSVNRLLKIGDEIGFKGMVKDYGKAKWNSGWVILKIHPRNLEKFGYRKTPIIPLSIDEYIRREKNYVVKSYEVEHVQYFNLPITYIDKQRIKHRANSIPNNVRWFQE